MRGSILKLSLITFFVCALGAMLLLTLQTLTSTPKTLNLKHPWAERPDWAFVRINACESSQHFKKSLEQVRANEFIWLSVKKDPSTSEWILLCDQGPEASVTMAQALALLREENLPFVLNVDSRRETDLPSLLEKLSAFEESKSIGLTSSVRKVAQELRKLKPQWIFGADLPSLTKAKTFYEFGLLGMVELWPDFFVIPKDFNDAENFAQELRRQGKIAVVEATQFRTVAPQ